MATQIPDDLWREISVLLGAKDLARLSQTSTKLDALIKEEAFELQLINKLVPNEQVTQTIKLFDYAKELFQGSATYSKIFLLFNVLNRKVFKGFEFLFNEEQCFYFAGLQQNLAIYNYFTKLFNSAGNIKHAIYGASQPRDKSFLRILLKNYVRSELTNGMMTAGDIPEYYITREIEGELASIYGTTEILNVNSQITTDEIMSFVGGYMENQREVKRYLDDDGLNCIQNEDLSSFLDKYQQIDIFDFKDNNFHSYFYFRFKGLAEFNPSQELINIFHSYHSLPKLIRMLFILNGVKFVPGIEANLTLFSSPYQPEPLQNNEISLMNQLFIIRIILSEVFPDLISKSILFKLLNPTQIIESALLTISYLDNHHEVLNYNDKINYCIIWINNMMKNHNGQLISLQANEYYQHIYTKYVDSISRPVDLYRYFREEE